VHLEPDQIALLNAVVEASRNVPRDQRGSFVFLELTQNGRTVVQHVGMEQMFVSFGDLRALEDARLISLRWENDRVGKFDVTPAGIAAYEQIKAAAAKPLAVLKAQVTDYIQADRFRKDFGAAYERWKRAADLLWSADAPAQLSTIGHLCREAMQEYADRLLAITGVSAAVGEKAKTVARIRAVLHGLPSSSRKAFLDALLVYWGTLSDLVQRQEHAGEKEQEPLVWEDAQRVVFHTAVVMHEISSAVFRQRRAG
jgi:hypothetical protein